MDLVLVGPVDAVPLGEIGVRRRRQAAHVVVTLVRLHLEQALVDVGVDVDVERVDVPGPVALVVLVPRQNEVAATDVALDVVRAGRRVHGHAVRVDLGLRRDGLEERHRELREHAAVRVRQPQDELVPAGDSPGHVRRVLPAVDGIRVADDVVHERRGRRLLRLRRGAIERPLEVLRGHGRAVGEAETLADGERVGLPVVRDDRHRDRGLRDEPSPGGGGLVRIVHELEAGGVLHLPADHVIGKRRIAEVEIRIRHVQSQGAALLGGLAARRGLREARDDEQQCSERGHEDRKPEPSVHVTPFQVVSRRNAAGRAHGMHPQCPKTRTRRVC